MGTSWTPGIALRSSQNNHLKLIATSTLQLYQPFFPTPVCETLAPPLGPPVSTDAHHLLYPSTPFLSVYYSTPKFYKQQRHHNKSRGGIPAGLRSFPKLKTPSGLQDHNNNNNNQIQGA